MVKRYRYIQIAEDGRIKVFCQNPVEGVTIDTDGLEISEKPTDAVYALYYSKEQGLYWVKVAENEEETAEPSQLDRIEEKVNIIANGTDVVTGQQESYYSKNKGGSRDGKLKRITIAVSVILAVLVVLYFVSIIIYPAGA